MSAAATAPMIEHAMASGLLRRLADGEVLSAAQLIADAVRDSAPTA